MKYLLLIILLLSCAYQYNYVDIFNYKLPDEFIYWDDKNYDKIDILKNQIKDLIIYQKNEDRKIEIPKYILKIKKGNCEEKALLMITALYKMYKIKCDYVFDKLHSWVEYKGKSYMDETKDGIIHKKKGMIKFSELNNFVNDYNNFIVNYDDFMED